MVEVTEEVVGMVTTALHPTREVAVVEDATYANAPTIVEAVPEDMADTVGLVEEDTVEDAGVNTAPPLTITTTRGGSRCGRVKWTWIKKTTTSNIQM